MMKTRKGYKVYPLTVAQKFHLYYLPHCPSAAVLNIGTSLTIEVEIDWEVLKQSVNKAYERCEGMRVRFAKDKEGNYYQYVVKHEEQDIEFVDFTGKTMEEAEETMKEWTRVPFRMEDAQLTRIVMIKMPDGFSGVYFLGHHMIVDAQSLIGFLKDIIELYCNAKYEGVPYPKDMCSYIEQIQKDLAYESGSGETGHSLKRRSRPLSPSLTVSGARTNWKPPGRCSRTRTCAPHSVLLTVRSPHWISSIWKASPPSA